MGKLRGENHPFSSPVVPQGAELCSSGDGSSSKPAFHTMPWLWGHCVVFHLVYHLNIHASPTTGLPQTHFFIVLLLNREMVEPPRGLKKQKYETSQTAKYAKLSPVFF